MRVLLDENLPRRLKSIFWPDIDVRSTKEMGWAGKVNGELLGLMTLHGFTILITADKALPSQQNLPRFPITVYLLRTVKNDFEHLAPLVQQVREQLTTEPPPTGLFVVQADA